MTLQAKVATFPASPGVYLMKDSQGRVLYVGKAMDLKKRVASYFGERAAERYQIKFLMNRVSAIDTIVTDSEKEALLLENTLIKKHQPKYNLQLRDDKSYLSLRLSIKDKFPRLYATRQIKKDGSAYFGPYASAAAARETLEFIEHHFRLRTCSDNELANRVRPCIQYQIHRCDAPCVRLITPEAYGKIAQQVRIFLQGKKQDLLQELEVEMSKLAEREEFEKAAQTRDLVLAIRETLAKQKVARHTWVDQDAVGLYREGEQVTLCLLLIREGKVWESRLYHLKSHEAEGEIFSQFLNQHYHENQLIPDEILLPACNLPAELFAEILTERRGKKVSLLLPKSGDRSDLLKLAQRNAQEGFRHRAAKEVEIEAVLTGLQSSLKLQNYPRRIECFDISNLSGKQAVGSLVCFVEGSAYKAGYRRFRIKTIEGPNDYAMMKEMLQRRLLRETTGVTSEKWVRPDLIVIDGGRGQLSVVQKLMNELNITGIDLVALAKAREGESADKAYLPGRKNPVRFRSHSSLLHLLMRVRDEAHRFAISYHKKIRAKEFLK